MTKDFHENRFESIQALRGVAAVLVVLEHVRFLSCGAFGVDIFFCISGFMMMYTTHRDRTAFFRRRLIRIVPFYALMTLATYAGLVFFPALFQQTKADPMQLLKSLLFIPFDIGDGVLQPILRIGWTVNCEIFFYFLFWVSYHISVRFRGLLCSALLLGMVVCARIVPHAGAPLAFYGDPVMLEFSLGIGAYYIAQWIYGRLTREASPKEAARRRALGIACLAASLLLFAILIATKRRVDISGFRRPLLWGVPALALFLCAFTYGLIFRTGAILTRLGDLSFSLYLVHYYPILFLDRKICDLSTARPASILATLVGVSSCILLAYAAWLLIEKNLTAWLKKHLIRRM